MSRREWLNDKSILHLHFIVMLMRNLFHYSSSDLQSQINVNMEQWTVLCPQVILVEYCWAPINQRVINKCCSILIFEYFWGYHCIHFISVGLPFLQNKQLAVNFGVFSATPSPVFTSEERIEDRSPLRELRNQQRSSVKREWATEKKSFSKVKGIKSVLEVFSIYI